MDTTCQNPREGRPCGTPLDEAGACVTCAAEGEGLKLLRREQYAQIRELHTLLEEKGIDAEMERVPAGRPEERAHPLWNLYVAEGEVEAAMKALGSDWAALLEAPEALEAAQRGGAGIQLDQEGDVTCPACGHVFRLKPGEADCPDCGLSFGVPDQTP
jgi:hypothetical protein